MIERERARDKARGRPPGTEAGKGAGLRGQAHFAMPGGQIPPRARAEKGMAVIVALVITVVLVTLVLALCTTVRYHSNWFRKSSYTTRTFHLAEAGIDKALFELSEEGREYRGEKETSLGEGSFTVTVEEKGEVIIIESRGKILRPGGEAVTRTVKLHCSLEKDSQGNRKIKMESWKEIRLPPAGDFNGAVTGEE